MLVGSFVYDEEQPFYSMSIDVWARGCTIGVCSKSDAICSIQVAPHDLHERGSNVSVVA
jgi:hypothetical protein